MTAVNIAYDEVETRNFVKLKLTSLALTLGRDRLRARHVRSGRRRPRRARRAAAGDRRHDPRPGRAVGPAARRLRRRRSPSSTGSPPTATRRASAGSASGAVVVTVIWAIVSVGFALYVNNFGSYDKTYGAIAGVIVLMLWLYLTCYLVLLGAEINAEAEHQTAHDTTEGEPAADGRPRRRRWPTRCPSHPEPQKGDSDPTRKKPERLTRTCERDERGLATTSTRLRPATDVDGRARPPPRHRPTVSSSARAMPVRRVGENVPLVTSPIRAPSASSTAMPGRGMPRPVARRPHSRRAGPASFSASSASRPQNAGFFQPTAQPRAPGSGVMSQRQLVPVQRVAHLGAQRVARAQAARPDAEVLPGARGRRPTARPPGRRRPAARSRARRCSRCGRRSPRRRRARRCRSRTTCRPARPAARAVRAPAASAAPARRGRRPPRAGRSPSRPPGAASASRRSTSAALAAFGTSSTWSGPCR